MGLVRLILAFALLAGCAAQTSGLMVSSDAQALGGSLFLEPTGDGGRILVLDGEITDRTAQVFEAITSEADLGGLAITQSPGGNLLAAHRIGRQIRARKMDTALAVFCGSACVDIFISGRTRGIAEAAELALHPTRDRGWGYSYDKPYWDGLGFGAVNDAVYAIEGNGVWVISSEEALRLGLANRTMRLGP